MTFTTRDNRTVTATDLSGRPNISVAYFSTEDEATIAHDAVRESGNTYAGGYFAGTPCGREPGRDYTDKAGARKYAVTY